MTNRDRATKLIAEWTVASEPVWIGLVNRITAALDEKDKEIGRLREACEAGLKEIEAAPLLNNSGVSPKDFKSLTAARHRLTTALKDPDPPAKETQ